MKFNIEELKAQHGDKLSLSTVTTSWGEKFEFVLKRPSSNVIQALAALKKKTDKDGNTVDVDSTRAMDILIKNIVVDGDLEALNEAEVYKRVLQDCREQFKDAKSEVKKL